MSEPFESDFVLLVRANSIIQREAILAALREESIDVRAPELTLNRSLTETTLDLSHAGYSAVQQTGFPIYIRELHRGRAQAIVDKVIREYNDQETAVTPRPLQKFYICSLYSVAVPGLMHLIALFHMRQHFKMKEREKINWLYMGGALILFAASAVIGGIALNHWTQVWFK